MRVATLLLYRPAKDAAIELFYSAGDANGSVSPIAAVVSTSFRLVLVHCM